MAKIVGGIASSHTPTIGFALDTGKQNDPVWAPIFEGYKPVQALAGGQEARRAVHDLQRSRHQLLLRSLLAVRARHRRRVSRRRRRRRAARHPAVEVTPKLAQHIARGLVADEFDLSYFQDKGLDHGCFSPLSMLWPHEAGLARRDRAAAGRRAAVSDSRRRGVATSSGKSLRKAIESYPEDLKVAIVATGGLSHQVHGERCGFNNTPWDLEFLDLLEKDPEKLTKMTVAEYAELGGMEGAEVIMWLIMRGALTPEGQEAAPDLLPAVDDADRHAILRERLERVDAAKRRSDRAARGARARGHREAAGHVSVHARPQRQGVPAEQVPALADRAGDARSSSAPIRKPLFEAAGLTEEERDLVRAAIGAP